MTTKSAPVQIEIGMEYRVASDALQWTIRKFNGIDKDGERIYKAVSYHATLASAINSLAQLMLRQSGAKTVAQLQTAADEIANQFREVFSGLNANLIEVTTKNVD